VGFVRGRCGHRFLLARCTLYRGFKLIHGWDSYSTSTTRIIFIPEGLKGQRAQSLNEHAI
jgi:hypothetical protein